MRILKIINKYYDLFIEIILLPVIIPLLYIGFLYERRRIALNIFNYELNKRFGDADLKSISALKSLKKEYIKKIKKTCLIFRDYV